MRVAVGANNRGVVVRDNVIRLLQQLGCAVEQVEIPDHQAAEYPEVAASVAMRVRQGKADSGVLIGRSGMGMCIVANKFPGVRAAVCHDEFSADSSRRHLDANVICLSAELVGGEMIDRIVRVWLQTPFDGGRHARRIERVALLERETLRDGHGLAGS